jgi:hypothetical protein
VSPRFRYTYHGDQVLEEIDAAPDRIKRDFVSVIESLAENPFGTSIGVRPLKGLDFSPQMYSVPFDDALLVFQVMADYPIILLVHITWRAGHAPRR